MVVASHPLPFSREKTSSENSTQHFLNCPLIQVLQFKLTNDQDSGYHISKVYNRIKQRFPFVHNGQGRSHSVNISGTWSCGHEEKDGCEAVQELTWKFSLHFCCRTERCCYWPGLRGPGAEAGAAEAEECWQMYKYRVYYIIHPKKILWWPKCRPCNLRFWFTLICMLEGEHSGLIEDHFWNFSGLLGFIGWVGDWSVVRFTPRGLASDQVSANFFKWISMWQYRCRYSISDIQL